MDDLQGIGQVRRICGMKNLPQTCLVIRLSVMCIGDFIILGTNELSSQCDIKHLKSNWSTYNYSLPVS